MDLTLSHQGQPTRRANSVGVMRRSAMVRRIPRRTPNAERLASAVQRPRDARVHLLGHGHVRVATLRDNQLAQRVANVEECIRIHQRGGLVVWTFDDTAPKAIEQRRGG